MTSTLALTADQQLELDVVLGKSRGTHANRDGPAMRVLMDTMPDGSVRLVLPAGAAPDTVGYNRNRAFQKERKTKIAARLRAKLDARR